LHPKLNFVIFGYLNNNMKGKRKLFRKLPDAPQSIPESIEEKKALLRSYFPVLEWANEMIQNFASDDVDKKIDIFEDVVRDILDMPRPNKSPINDKIKAEAIDYYKLFSAILGILKIITNRKGDRIINIIDITIRDLLDIDE